MRKGIVGLMKQIFAPRHREIIPVYLSRFESVDKMITSGLVSMDFLNKYITLDAVVHINYMNKPKEYANFFDTLRSYMNFHLGLLQKPFLAPEYPIKFAVVMKEIIRIDCETGELYDPAKEKYHVLLLGTNASGCVKTEVAPLKNENNDDSLD